MSEQFSQVEIESFYNDLLKQGFKSELRKGAYEVIEPKGYEILTLGNKYVKLVAVSRHKTNKHLVKIIVKTSDTIKSVTVTTDHVCMVLNKEHFFENKKSCEINVNDMVVVYDSDKNTELLGYVDKIEDLGETSEYVYDCEVKDDMHSFYADDVLVHNSQFVNLQCITDKMKKDHNLDDVIYKWTDDQKMMLWNYVDDFVENTLNKYIQDLVAEKCFSENSKVLRYSLEYIADVAIYEKKKHYAAHKIVSEGPELVDKTKYTGIELKKRVVPKQIKSFLGEIYNKTLTGGWTGDDYRRYINELYDKFCALKLDDIALWKGYNAERSTTGFLKMEVGSTGIATACNYYNQLLKKFNIGDKYDEIRVGDQVRFTYLIPDNEFGIAQIAYHDGQWPHEFNGILQPDYALMFEKVVLDSLKGFLNATRFHNSDPRNQMVEDIFAM